MKYESLYRAWKPTQKRQQAIYTLKSTTLVYDLILYINKIK
jgi:hypothetical protein